MSDRLCAEHVPGLGQHVLHVMDVGDRVEGQRVPVSDPEP